MYATVLHGPGDIRYETVGDPKILKPTDAIIKLSATCICGSDLWPYRGLQPMDAPMHMPRILRHRGRGGPRCARDSPRSVRCRLVLPVGQHLPAL